MEYSNVYAELEESRGLSRNFSKARADIVSKALVQGDFILYLTQSFQFQSKNIEGWIFILKFQSCSSSHKVAQVAF